MILDEWIQSVLAADQIGQFLYFNAFYLSIARI